MLRADGIFAYQLAAAVDDAAQRITHVVRGADLLDSTFRQIHIQAALGLSHPQYLHVPVAVNASGEKLSKQTNAPPVNGADPSPQLWDALEFLGQNPPPELSRGPVSALWEWAIAHWDSARMRSGANPSGRRERLWTRAAYPTRGAR